MSLLPKQAADGFSSSYCSLVSLDQAISSDCEDSIGSYSYVSNDDFELDPLASYGNFILERPLTLDELDKMCVNGRTDKGIRLKAGSRSVAVESIFSNSSDGFDSDMDSSWSSSDDSDDESVSSLVDRWHDQEKPGFLGDEKPQTPTRSDSFRRKLDCTGLLMLLDESAPIDDSTLIDKSPACEDRWYDRLSKPSVQKAMRPPLRRKFSNGKEDREVIKGQSSDAATLEHEMMNSGILAEFGLQLSDSIAAKKVTEAILMSLKWQAMEFFANDDSRQ
jgi:hypothetical protein